MEILRDYILGGIVTPLDIFEGIPFSSEDLYRLLSLLSFSDSPSLRAMRNRIFSEVVNKSGSSFRPQMLGENASVSIYTRYFHRKIEIPNLEVKLEGEEMTDTSFRKVTGIRRDMLKKKQEVLRGKRIMKILTEKYGIRKDVGYVYDLGMSMRYDHYFIWDIHYHSVPTAFVMFMNSKEARYHLGHLYSFMKPIVSEKKKIISLGSDALRRYLDTDSEMVEIFHKAGAFIASSIFTMMHVWRHPQKVEKMMRHIWLPMRYALRLHVKIIDEGDSSSTVEYGGKKYKVGIEERRDIEGKKDHIRYVYRYYNVYDGSEGMSYGNSKEEPQKAPLGASESEDDEYTFPYESMLLIATMSFIRGNESDNEDLREMLDSTRDKIINLIQNSNLQSYRECSGYMEELSPIMHKVSIQREDLIRNFIVYDSLLLP